MKVPTILFAIVAHARWMQCASYRFHSLRCRMNLPVRRHLASGVGCCVQTCKNPSHTDTVMALCPSEWETHQKFPILLRIFRCHTVYLISIKRRVAICACLEPITSASCAAPRDYAMRGKELQAFTSTVIILGQSLEAPSKSAWKDVRQQGLQGAWADSAILFLRAPGLPKAVNLTEVGWDRHIPHRGAARLLCCAWHRVRFPKCDR